MRELAGLRGFGETVEMCGKAYILKLLKLMIALRETETHVFEN